MNLLWTVIVGDHVTAYPHHQADLVGAEVARLRDSGVDVVVERMTATELAMLAVEAPKVTVTYWQPAGSARPSGSRAVRVLAVLRRGRW